MSRNLLLGSSERGSYQHKPGQAQLGVIWNQDNDISNRFDIPYSPPMTLQEPTPKYPLANVVRRMLNKSVALAASYTLPPRLHGLNRAKPRQQHTLWDKVQFVVFSLCLVVLLHSLSGLSHAHHKCDSCLPGAEAVVVAGRDLARENPRADVATRHGIGSFHSMSTTTHKAADENDITSNAIQVNGASSLDQEPFIGPRAKGYKIEDLEPFVDTGLLDVDGQPFALKIHLEGREEESAEVKRGGVSGICRGSRC